MEKNRTASKRPPIDDEVEQCRKFITRSEKRVAELDAERAAEFSALAEAKGRLQRLEAEQAAATSLPEPSAPLLPSPECAEIAALKAKLAEVEGERDAAIRNQSKKRPATMSSVASASAAPNAHDQSSQRVERVVAGMPRGVGTSIGRRKRVQSDGVMFSLVRWCSENVRIDGGHGAVRSWPWAG